MKKIFLVLISIFILSSCAASDIINEEDEYLLNNPSKNELSKSNLSSYIEKYGTVMDLAITAGYQLTNGGCTVTASGNAYGPEPLYLSGYMVRGYGKPRRDVSYAGIQLRAGNRPKTVTYAGQDRTIDDPFENAISIEFPFSANVTYEITLETLVEDFIYKEQHDQYDQNDDYNGLQQSQAFPTLALELKDSPEIIGNNPCGGRPVIGNLFVDHNYFKKQKVEITVPPSYEEKTFTYKFSTTENKNALIIYFLPEQKSLSYPFVPESSFNIYIKNIKIVEKPFEQTFDPSVPCDNLGGFRC